MFDSIRSRKQQQHGKGEKEWLGVSFKPENFIPGVVIGFILGLFLDLAKPPKNPPSKQQYISSNHAADEELKMVLVVRQDLKMGPGKIASQCARKIQSRLNLQNLPFIFVALSDEILCRLVDAATGMYSELVQSQRSLLRQWEQSGQPKIVVTCKNQKEMNRLQEQAESIGLPMYVVADAGRTQVAAGSKTVLAIGPGRKSSIDSITGKQRLL